MATSNTTPVVIPQPIAAQATSENINVIPNGATGTNGASFQEGFPAITRMPVIENPLPTQVSGMPPKQQDFNGLFNVVSQHNFFAQNGGMYSFNQAVSDAIGGYPKNAVLWYFPENEDPCLVRSLINDNTNNFVNEPTLIDGIHWEMLVNPSGYANIDLSNLDATGQAKLDAKANTDASNFTATAKETIVGWGMPDYSAGVSIPFPTNTNYFTAPTDGIAVLYAPEIAISVNILYINGQQTSFRINGTNTYRDLCSLIVPLSKNEIIAFSTDSAGDNYSGTFYPYKGAI